MWGAQSQKTGLVVVGVCVFLPALPLFSPFFSWVHFVSFLQLFFLLLIPCL